MSGVPGKAVTPGVGKLNTVAKCDIATDAKKVLDQRFKDCANKGFKKGDCENEVKIKAIDCQVELQRGGKRKGSKKSSKKVSKKASKKSMKGGKKASKKASKKSSKKGSKKH